jgi:hypothetical protein
MQSEINIQIGNKAPKDYFAELEQQVRGGRRRYGNLDSSVDLEANLSMHAIPNSIADGSIESYETFLKDRRRLMAQKMKHYYRQL